MSKTFIPRFMRAGGRLLPCARVERIRQDCSKWQMQARHKTGGLRIEAETLFVCGGAVQTPALLRRSGITRNVGDSLRLHPTVKVVARFPEAVNSAEMGVPAHQVKEFAPRLSFGCSISTPPYVALGMIDHPQFETDVSAVWAHMANYYAMIASESRGTVRPIGRFRDPLVRYSLTEKDRRDLADGFAKLAHMLFEAGAAAVYPGLSGGPELRCRDDIAKLPRVLPNGLASLMTIHLFSSCPMGEDERRCATDSFGRIHGFHNLFIADASLLCTAPGVNPQGSIMALTRRNALHFLGLL
jgi:choline dehydrogenase-like flavoprotein